MSPAAEEQLWAAEVLAQLVRRGQTLAVAESLTGGLLAATLVDVPGASRALRGGLVVYATDLKASLAGVPVGLLAERGPVDPEVAAALARGARDRCGADWGVATTGVAGPGSQDGVAVGTVFVAVAGSGGTQVQRHALRGGRRVVRVAAVAAALRLVADALSRDVPASQAPASQAPASQAPASQAPASDVLGGAGRSGGGLGGDAFGRHRCV